MRTNNELLDDIGLMDHPKIVETQNSRDRALALWSEATLVTEFSIR